MNPQTPASVTIIHADWNKPSDRNALLAVRYEVFVKEQQVPEEMERDEWDSLSHHVLAMSGDTPNLPIGTARLLPDGRIGRVAVLRDWRKKGVGTALMNEVLRLAQEHRFPETTLHAQSWTVGFYESLGFQCEGEEFEEAGIPHRHMRRTTG